MVVQRFVQFWWEHPKQESKWLAYSKGGGYCRWAGLDYYDIEWELNGARLKAYVLGRYPKSKFRLIVKSEDTIGLPALTWTTMARGKLAGRLIRRPCVVSSKGPGVFPDKESTELSIAAIFNSRLGSYLMRALSPGLEFGYKYVELFPMPTKIPERLPTLAKTAYQSARATKSRDPIEREYEALGVEALDSSGLYGTIVKLIQEKWHHIRTLLVAEAQIEEAVVEAYELSSDAITAVHQDIGTPVAYTTTTAYGTSDIQIDLLSYLREGEVNVGEMVDESGEAEIDEGDDLQGGISKGNPLPPDSDLEEISLALGRHPDEVLRAFEKLDPTLLRGAPILVRSTEDWFTDLALRLLGHRWPRQIEAGESIPAWADADGIIPLTEATGEPTLLDRVREHIAAEFESGDVTAIEREFEEIMGKPLGQWLTTEFFRHHISQFKKRPIAWQIQSGRFTTRQKPAFACLVYYHKLDGATLATIQSQHVRPLRQRYETELRGIESIPAAARSARQDTRRVELEAAIHELRDFDAALEQVAAQGFASQALEKIVAQEPLDRWCSIDGVKPSPEDREALFRQEQSYIPDINDGVRVNIAPMQKAGLLAANVLVANDVDQAIANRAEWRADERRWCREGKLPRPGWWSVE